MSGQEDDEIQDYFIKSAFPPLEVMFDILGVLEKGGTMTIAGIGAQLNRGRGVIERSILLLG